MSRLLPLPFGRVFLPFNILPHLVNAYRDVPIRGDAGDPTPNLVLVAKDLVCWVNTQSTDEKQIHGRKEDDASHKILFLQDPGISNGDVLQWVEGLRTSGVLHNLLVVSVNQSGNVGLCWVATANEIR